MAFRIERNDITKVRTDAIVNTANPLPIVGAGTDEAVYNAAGLQQLLRDRQKIGVIERGEAAYTPAHNLFATNGIRYIIHTVGISWQDGKQGEPEIMRNCYRNSLKLAQKLGCQSVSIPLLATGNYGFPKEMALNIALDEISKFLLETELKVALVVYDKESVRVSNRIFEGVKSFIDENYVAERKKPYDNVDDIIAREIRRQRSTPEANSYVQEKLCALSARRNEELSEAGSNFEQEAFLPKNSAASPARTAADSKNEGRNSSKTSVADFVAQNQGALNFADTLREHIRDKGWENKMAYKKSLIVDKKLFSKIISQNHIPGKHYVMSLGLALELDLNSFEAFLATANYALNPADMFDLVVKYCITQKIYNIMEIDAMLFKLELPCFIKDD